MKHLIHLKKDKILAKVIEEQGDIFEKEITTDLFKDILSSIVGQQLSTKAADTIWKRFEALFTNSKITPESILNISDNDIRNIGISRPKIKYIKGLSEMIIRKEIDLEQIHKLTDEEVIKELTRVKGIGPWTAEMILMFSLGREDVFSFGDLGLKNAISKLYLIDRDDLVEMEKIVDKWKPFRSYASRYLWMSLDNKKPDSQRKD